MIVPAAPLRLTGVLLSHVMAHEIAHYARMHYRPLEFAPEDIERLRLGMAAGRSAAGPAVSDLAGQPGAGQLPVAHYALGR